MSIKCVKYSKLKLNILYINLKIEKTLYLNKLTQLVCYGSSN